MHLEVAYLLSVSDGAQSLFNSVKSIPVMKFNTYIIIVHLFL